MKVLSEVERLPSRWPRLLTVASFCVAYQASSVPASRLINPDELAKILQSSGE